MTVLNHMPLSGTLKGAASIVGIGETLLGRVPGRSSTDLNAEAATAAVADAGLNFADVDGLLVFGSRADDHPRYQALLAEHLGMRLKHFTDVTKTGGASSASAVRMAASLIATGQCANVLIVFGDNLATGIPHEQMLLTYAEHHHPDYEIPFGPLIISLYALVADRFMHEYGWTSEQLAAVAVAQRTWARLNPKAQFRDEITVDDVLSSRMVTSPLHLLDCAPISDGAAAVLVAGRSYDASSPNVPVVVAGAGSVFSYYFIHDLPNYTDYLMAMARESADRAFAMAGLERSDVDVAFVGDPTTICVPVNLAGAGFCEAASAGEFVASGAIAPGGTLPVNTHGGCLSCAHPGTPGQLLHIVEAVRQLRGEAGDRQVVDADVGFVHGQAGVFTSHCSLVLTRGDQ
jgi:acetyl-CoA acetyltransferase